MLDLATQNDFDTVQTAKVNSIYESFVQLLEPAVDEDDSLAAPVAEALSAVEQVLAATGGGVGGMPEPTFTPVPEPEETDESPSAGAPAE